MSETRKALNYDLDDNFLKVNYPGSNYKNAWKDVKRFLYKNNFENRQYSGVVSIAPTTILDVQYVIEKSPKHIPGFLPVFKKSMLQVSAIFLISDL